MRIGKPSDDRFEDFAKLCLPRRRADNEFAGRKQGTKTRSKRLDKRIDGRVAARLRLARKRIDHGGKILRPVLHFAEDQFLLFGELASLRDVSGDLRSADHNSFSV